MKMQGPRHSDDSLAAHEPLQDVPLSLSYSSGSWGLLAHIDLQWPNWAKTTGCPVKFEFQINNKYNFSIDMSHAISETYLHWKRICCPLATLRKFHALLLCQEHPHNRKHWPVLACFRTMVLPLQSTRPARSRPPRHQVFTQVGLKWPSVHFP